VFLGGGLDAFPGGIAFRIRHPLHLLEAGDRVAHVSSVMDGFFAFVGECEVLVGYMIAGSFSDLAHASRQAKQWPLYSRHRRNPPTPPIDSSKAVSSINVTLAPVCLALVTGAQMATHSSWDLDALQPVFRTGNELRSADLRMSKEVESGPGFTLDRSWFANPDRNEHNSRLRKTEPPSAP